MLEFKDLKYLTSERECSDAVIIPVCAGREQKQKVSNNASNKFELEVVSVLACEGRGTGTRAC
jgi:hypothetical protein